MHIVAENMLGESKKLPWMENLAANKHDQAEVGTGSLDEVKVHE